MAAVLLVAIGVGISALAGAFRPSDPAPADAASAAQTEQPDASAAATDVTTTASAAADQDPYHLANAAAADPIVVGAGTTTSSGDGRMTFCAVGDNLISQAVVDSADLAGGEAGDGVYDFHSLYSAVAPTIADEFDVAFINQETVIGGPGDDGFYGSYIGAYPVFNTPDAMADALVDSGFDVIVCNSNHSYDRGAEGLTHEAALWQNYPEALVVGMGATPEQTQTIHVIERNGLRLAILSYNYGLNGYDIAEDGSVVDDYSGERIDGEGTLYNLVTEEKLRRDIPRAKAVADAVLVSLHCGTEYEHEPDSVQRKWAQLCADLGCDVLIGTHPHYTQPVEWIDGAAGNPMLVAWSLGDFVCGYNWMEDSMGAMVSFELVRDGDGVRIENPTWTPTLEHQEDGLMSVRFLKDYTAEDAARSTMYSESSYNTTDMVADVIGYGRDLAAEVAGSVVRIDD